MNEFERLNAIMERLRAEDGCPWDKEQTHSTLKAPVIEEACEVVCGIDIFEKTGNADNLKEELGDLLFQVIFHAQIAKEEGLFDIEDVCRGIADKLVRRHPHIFSGDTASTSEEVIEKWEEIKKQEKAGKEWMEAYLPAAFDESKQLIDVAVERKARKRAEKKKEAES